MCIRVCFDFILALYSIFSFVAVTALLLRLDMLLFLVTIINASVVALVCLSLIDDVI